MSHESYLFTDSHEWVTPLSDVVTVGITDHAQHMLGDIVFVDVPKAGKVVKKGDEMLVVESPKAAAEVYAPISGEIVEVNSDLESEPGKINAGAFGDGWLVKIKPANPAEFEALMAWGDYQKLVEG